ncbi:MAG: hypothetical protein KGJ66_09480 [Alphaproteobacteria bacterium]|nr:hypothetical protein [Alphaproteobacteria bacterium]
MALLVGVIAVSACASITGSVMSLEAGLSRPSYVDESSWLHQEGVCSNKSIGMQMQTRAVFENCMAKAFGPAIYQ